MAQRLWVGTGNSLLLGLLLLRKTVGVGGTGPSWEGCPSVANLYGLCVL